MNGEFSPGDRVIYHNVRGGNDQYNGRTARVTAPPIFSTVDILWDDTGRPWNCNLVNISLHEPLPTTHSNWSPS